MFSCLSPWSTSPIDSLSNQSAVILSFVAVLSYLIKGLDGHMPSVDKVLVRSRHLDTESTIKLKALTSKCYCLRN